MNTLTPLELWPPPRNWLLPSDRVSKTTPRNGVGEGEEVAGILRKRFDLALRDDTADFGRLGLEQRTGRDSDRIKGGRAGAWGGVAAHVKVERSRLRNLQSHCRGLAGAARRRDIHSIRAGRNAKHDVATVFIRQRLALVAGVDVGQRDFGACCGTAHNLAFQCCGG